MGVYTQSLIITLAYLTESYPLRICQEAKNLQLLCWCIQSLGTRTWLILHCHIDVPVFTTLNFLLISVSITLDHFLRHVPNPFGQNPFWKVYKNFCLSYSISILLTRYFQLELQSIPRAWSHIPTSPLNILA